MQSDTTAEISDTTATHIAFPELKIGIIGTDKGGTFDGLFRSLLNEPDTQHELTLPHTSQYNGVVEGALSLLRDNNIPFLETPSKARPTVCERRR